MRKKKDSIYKNNVNRDYSCIICGWNKRDAKGNHLTEGAHVREHKSGDEFDIETNMIDLCPNHHTEYDRHNFYIDVETKKIHFIDSSDEYEGMDLSEKISYVDKRFLAYRKAIYDKYHEDI